MQIHINSSYESNYNTVKRYENLLELKEFYIEKFKSHEKFNDFISQSYVSDFDDEFKEIKSIQMNIFSTQRMIKDMQDEYEKAQILEMQALLDDQEQEFTEAIGF